MRVVRSKKKWLAAAVAGLAMMGTLTAVALGELPPVNVVSTIYASAATLDPVHLNSDRVKFQTKDPTYVRVQELIFLPNSRSGWHHHPGIVIVAVKQGELTLTHSDCTSKTYGPNSANGAVFVEGGDDPGQASSVAGATVYVTYVAPNQGPVTSTTFRTEDTPITCP